MPSLNVASTRRRGRERSSWHHVRPHSVCEPTLPSIGHPGLRIAQHPTKGRIVIATRPLREGATVLRECPLNLCTLLPGYCFRCAARFVESVEPVRFKKGAQQCQRCSRFFCSFECIQSAQHVKHECAVVARLENPMQGAREGTVYAARYSEAIARLALLPLHAATDVAQQVEQLDSSFPSAPFGENRADMERALGRLLSVLPADIAGVPTAASRLWRLYGLIHTNTDVLDAPSAAPGQPKPPVPAFILRPLISLLAHACRPSCHLEDIDSGMMQAERGAAGASVLLKAAHDIAVGGELTRCYAGCLRESAQRFAECPLQQRREVLRSKGFHFECGCDLCLEQREVPI